jgi:hypothetical protein
MRTLLDLADRLPWSIVAIACLSLGLAPFLPEPHLIEKLRMLATASLSQPIDILDLLMHGAPFMVAALKVAAMRGRRRRA